MITVNRRHVLAGVLIVTVALAGCTSYGNSYGDSTDASPATDGQETGDSGGASDSAAVETVSTSADETVIMEQTSFQSSPTVSPGTVITFVNRDSYPHTVTISSQGIDKQVAGGERVTLKFNEAASYNIVCTLHPGMETTVSAQN